MKKQILTLGMMCAAAFTLTNCDKQSTDPQLPIEGTPFEIFASTVDTKTANDGLKTVWAENDALNVFHAVAGTTDYGTNDKFTWTGTDNKFSGELTEALGDGSYDWYVLYPYDANLTDPTGANKKRYVYIGDRSDMGQTQAGNDSKAHLIYDNSNKAGLRNCPLYAVAKNVASSATPTFTMCNLASVVAVKVTNTTDADLTVSNVTFTAPDGTSIVGTYYINFTDNGETIYNKGTYTSNVAKLTVDGGEAIAKNGSATFYLAVAPFTAETNSTLKISVNGYEKPLTMSKDITFEAGQIKAVAFVYDKEVTPTPKPSDYVAKFEATKIGSGYGPHEGVESNGYKWTVTFGQGTYIGTNKDKKANCKLGSAYEKVGTPCEYTADQTQVAAIISESKFSNVSKVVVDGDTDKYNPEKISLVYSVDGTSYTLIETKDYAKSNEFSFDKIADAYYAVVLYYSGTSFMRTNNLAITFYE